jgi:hypothetical protein
MKIKIDTTGFAQSRWYEYVVRFLFGGIITAAAGLIAKHFGPAVGGLFLAFPAILPASATLIEKHEREKKQQAGENGTNRARAAAGIDAAGAALGCFGLAAFAIVVWKGLPHFSTASVLLCATAAWSVVALSLWELREKGWRPVRKAFRKLSKRRELCP